MNGEVSHKRAGRLHRGVLTSFLTIACYVGCEPDMDQLSSQYGKGGGGNSGASGGVPAAGGITAKGGANSGGTAHPSGGDAGMTSITGGAAGNGSGGIASGGTSTQTGGAGGESGGAGGTGGEGGAVCSPGFVSCPDAPECSTDLKVGNADSSGTTVTDCGACGVSCSAEHVSKTSCAAGVCSPTCIAGFLDCNAGLANDGCETPASPSNCGRCGHVCSSSGTSSVACGSSGTCTPTCAPKYADCNADTGVGTDDGCEVYLDELDRCATSCSSSVACATNQVCNSGACGAPQGIVKLSVPLTAANQAQRYADVLATPPNLLRSFLVVRAYAPGATAGFLSIFSSDADLSEGGRIGINLSELAKGWTDIKVNLGGALGGTFDPSYIRQVNLEVNSGSMGPWANPTVVYVDGIRSTNQALNETFDASASSMVQSQTAVVAGSTLTWLNAMP